MEALGFDEFLEDNADGVQVLRYNETKAYRTHMDYMEDKTRKHRFNFDSASTGSNRFATFLIYFNSVEVGGQTIFPHASATETNNTECEESALSQVRMVSGLARNSWEEDLAVACRTGFVIEPRPQRTIMFYNQVSNIMSSCSSYGSRHSIVCLFPAS